MIKYMVEVPSKNGPWYPSVFVEIECKDKNEYTTIQQKIYDIYGSYKYEKSFS
jgi:hypothetical protein